MTRTEIPETVPPAQPAEPANGLRTADRLSMAVPGDWMALPLDPRTRDRRIGALVERRLGRSDRIAYLRRQATVQLRRFAAQAVGQGAFFVAIHSRMIGGMPVSATAMAVLLPAVKGPDQQLLPDADTIAAALAGGGERGEVLDHTVVDLQVGRAARVRRRTSTELAGRSGQPVESEGVSYFVPLPEAGKTLGLVFSTPILPLADAYTAVFDAMAATAKWVEATTEEAGR